MTVDALLCDAATVRDGLLHILGGGVTRVWRESFPTTLGVNLALMFTLHQTEAKVRHRLRVVVQGEDGGEAASLDGEFGVTAIAPGVKPGEQVAMPMVLNLMAVPILKAGTYSIELLVDSQHIRSLPFVADLASNLPKPR